jgi:hypothetical protein
MDKASFIRELEHTTSTREIFRTRDPSEWLLKLIPDPDSLPSILEFLSANDLFDDFCLHLLKDKALARSIFGPLGQEVTIDEQMILAADKELHTKMVKAAEETMREMGPLQFKYRERYCLEALGCYLCSKGTAIAKEKC